MSVESAMKNKPGRPKKSLAAEPVITESFKPYPIKVVDTYDRRHHTINIASELAKIMITARGGKMIPTVPIDAWRIAKEIVDLSYDGEKANVPVVPAYTNLNPAQLAMMSGNEAWDEDDDGA